MKSDSGSGLPPASALDDSSARDDDSRDELDTGDLGGDLGAHDSDDGVQVELDESVIEETEKEEVVARPARKRSSTAMRKATAPAPVVARRAPRPAPPPLHLDPGQVRSLLAEQPGMVEKGLSVHTDAAGRQVGLDFETPVGDIDLLARDPRGAFVIVLVIEEEDPDLVPGLLRRMGWVRKHLCKSGETVRAVAVMNEVPESAFYAAAGLSDGVIRFVGYRFALEFYEHTEAGS
jgi:hypothetical protein